MSIEGKPPFEPKQPHVVPKKEVGKGFQLGIINTFLHPVATIKHIFARPITDVTVEDYGEMLERYAKVAEDKYGLDGVDQKVLADLGIKIEMHDRHILDKDLKMIKSDIDIVNKSLSQIPMNRRAAGLGYALESEMKRLIDALPDERPTVSGLRQINFLTSFYEHLEAKNLPAVKVDMNVLNQEIAKATSPRKESLEAAREIAEKKIKEYFPPEVKEKTLFSVLSDTDLYKRATISDPKLNPVLKFENQKAVVAGGGTLAELEEIVEELMSEIDTLETQLMFARLDVPDELNQFNQQHALHEQKSALLNTALSKINLETARKQQDQQGLEELQKITKTKIESRDLGVLENYRDQLQGILRGVEKNAPRLVARTQYFLSLVEQQIAVEKTLETCRNDNQRLFTERNVPELQKLAKDIASALPSMGKEHPDLVSDYEDLADSVANNIAILSTPSEEEVKKLSNVRRKFDEYLQNRDLEGLEFFKKQLTNYIPVSEVEKPGMVSNLKQLLTAVDQRVAQEKTLQQLESERETILKSGSFPRLKKLAETVTKALPDIQKSQPDMKPRYLELLTTIGMDIDRPRIDAASNIDELRQVIKELEDEYAALEQSPHGGLGSETLIMQKNQVLEEAKINLYYKIKESEAVLKNLKDLALITERVIENRNLSNLEAHQESLQKFALAMSKSHPEMVPEIRRHIVSVGRKIAEVRSLEVCRSEVQRLFEARNIPGLKTFAKDIEKLAKDQPDLSSDYKALGATISSRIALLSMPAPGGTDVSELKSLQRMADGYIEKHDMKSLENFKENLKNTIPFIESNRPGMTPGVKKLYETVDRKVAQEKIFQLIDSQRKANVEARNLTELKKLSETVAKAFPDIQKSQPDMVPKYEELLKVLGINIGDLEIEDYLAKANELMKQGDLQGLKQFVEDTRKVMEDLERDSSDLAKARPTLLPNLENLQKTLGGVISAWHHTEFNKNLNDRQTVQREIETLRTIANQLISERNLSALTSFAVDLEDDISNIKLKDPLTQKDLNNLQKEVNTQIENIRSQNQLKLFHNFANRLTWERDLPALKTLAKDVDQVTGSQDPQVAEDAKGLLAEINTQIEKFERSPVEIFRAIAGQLISDRNLPALENFAEDLKKEIPTIIKNHPDSEVALKDLLIEIKEKSDANDLQTIESFTTSPLQTASTVRKVSEEVFIPQSELPELFDMPLPVPPRVGALLSLAEELSKDSGKELKMDSSGELHLSERSEVGVEADKAFTKILQETKECVEDPKIPEVLMQLANSDWVNDVCQNNPAMKEELGMLYLMPMRDGEPLYDKILTEFTKRNIKDQDPITLSNLYKYGPVNLEFEAAMEAIVRSLPKESQNNKTLLQAIEEYRNFVKEVSSPWDKIALIQFPKVDSQHEAKTLTKADQGKGYFSTDLKGNTQLIYVGDDYKTHSLPITRSTEGGLRVTWPDGKIGVYAAVEELCSFCSERLFPKSKKEFVLLENKLQSNNPDKLLSYTSKITGAANADKKLQVDPLTQDIVVAQREQQVLGIGQVGKSSREILGDVINKTKELPQGPKKTQIIIHLMNSAWVQDICAQKGNVNLSKELTQLYQNNFKEILPKVAKDVENFNPEKATKQEATDLLQEVTVLLNHCPDDSAFYPNVHDLYVNSVKPKFHNNEKVSHLVEKRIQTLDITKERFDKIAAYKAWQEIKVANDDWRNHLAFFDKLDPKIFGAYKRVEIKKMDKELGLALDATQEKFGKVDDYSECEEEITKVVEKTLSNFPIRAAVYNELMPIVEHKYPERKANAARVKELIANGGSWIEINRAMNALLKGL